MSLFDRIMFIISSEYSRSCKLTLFEALSREYIMTSLWNEQSTHLFTCLAEFLGVSMTDGPTWREDQSHRDQIGQMGVHSWAIISNAQERASKFSS